MTLALLFRPAPMPYLTEAMPSLTTFSRALVPSVGSVYVAVHSIVFLSLLIFISYTAQPVESLSALGLDTGLPHSVAS